MRVPTQWLRFASAAALVVGGAFSTEAQEIKFWTLTFDNPNVTKSFDKIIKDFEAANPGVTASGSDQAPDIYFMWAGPRPRRGVHQVRPRPADG